jgi:hypothetical protein
MNETHIDVGNFDWIVAEDENGNYWVRPSLDWKDGEIYESLRNGQFMLSQVMQVIEN